MAVQWSGVTSKLLTESNLGVTEVF